MNRRGEFKSRRFGKTASALLVPQPSFWTPERDAAVIETKGKYSKIATLASVLQVPSKMVVARWHVLRARGVS